MKAGLDRGSKRYVKSKPVKDRGSTVSRLLLTPSTSPFTFFLLTSLWRPIVFSKPLFLVLLPQQSRFFDSSLQWQVDINFLAPSECSTCPKIPFLTDVQPKNFYIHRFTFNISKIVATFRNANRKARRQKDMLESPTLQNAFCQKYGLDYTSYQKHNTWSRSLSKALISHFFKTSAISSYLPLIL